MISEITDNKNANAWLFFDGACRACSALARLCSRRLARRGFRLAPLQTLWVRERLGLPEDELLREMRLLTRQGAVFGGVEALLELARGIWWARPLVWASGVPGVTAGLRKAYAWIARHRYCLGGACATQASSRHHWKNWLGGITACLLPIAALLLGSRLTGWIWMWAIALGVFAAAKWLTMWRLRVKLERAVRGRMPVGRGRLLAYAFLWPGMNAQAFCLTRAEARPAAREWALAAGKALLGIGLVRVIAPGVGIGHPLVQGWVGMIGLVLAVHFGLFHVLSLLWRTYGWNAPPIMDSPLLATSLSQFWGGRWNAAFSDLVREHVFKPLGRRMPPVAALFAVFLISGLLHDLVISVPARSGYGWPTLYFAFQGLAVLAERSALGRALRLGSGWRGWAFVLVTTGGPVIALFHRPFILNVIVPMLRAIGTT